MNTHAEEPAAVAPEPPPAPPAKQAGPRYIVELILALIAIISVAFGVFFFLENRYAKNMHMSKLELRLDLKISEDQLLSVEERILKFEGELGVIKESDLLKSELRKLRKQEDNITEKIQSINKRIIEED